jgi:hypothetical protein
MLEVEAVPQSFIPLVQIDSSIGFYMRNLLLVENLDLYRSASFSNRTFDLTACSIEQ